MRHTQTYYPLTTPLLQKQLLVLIGCMLFSFPLLAQSYQLKTSSINNGTSKVSSASYSLHSSVGQTFSGQTTSTNYKLNAGFLPTAIPRQAELTLASSLNVSPAQVAPGETFSLSFTLFNNGAVGVFTTISAEVYLSANTTFEPEDIRLDSFGIVTDLPAGDSFNYPTGGSTKNIIIPSVTANGDYQIFVVLITADPVDEINEVNVFGKTLAVDTNTGTADIQSPTITSPSGGFDGTAITATITDASEIVSVTLFYKPITGSTFMQATMNPGSGSTYTSEPEDTWADELGLEGYIIAEDEVGNATANPATFYLYRSVPADAEIPFEGASFNGKSATYRMFSIPYDLGNSNRLADIISSVLGTQNEDIWRVFHYTQGDYIELSDGGRIEPGKGYWFNTTEKDFAIPIDEGTAIASNQNDPFAHTFQQMWNQIGNPYPFPIDWSTIQDANPQLGLGSPHIYRNGSYEQVSALEPWEGAFVFAETAGTATYPVMAKTGSRVTEKTSEGYQWKLPITLSFNGRKHTGAIGMHPEAAPGKDVFDEMTVPRFISYLEMNSIHEEYIAPKFAHDIVPIAETHEWYFHLAANEKSGNATVSWDPQNIISSPGKVYLLDLRTLESLDMSSVGQYTFEWSEGERLMIIFSKDGDFLPGIDRIGTSFPNPFRRGISIPVIVSQTNQHLHMKIHDISGKQLFETGFTFPERGFSTIHWEGTDTMRNEVREGVYFLHIQLGSMKRMIRVIKH